MKRLSLFYFLFLAAFGENSFAVTGEETFVKKYTLGLELNHYQYTEPDLIAHSGFMLGVYGEMTWLYLPNLSGVTYGKLVSGELNYEGSLCDVNTNVCSGYKAKTIDVIARVTHRFEYSVQENLSFFLGPGFRLLVDRGRGEGFYTRTGSYFFIPTGFHLDYQNFILDFEYDVLISGTMNSKLSEVNKTFGDIRHKQTVGSAYKVMLTKQLDGFTSQPLVVTLYFESWTLESSEPEQLLINNQPSGNYFIEPKNYSQMLGLQIGLWF